jgi:uncharacterized phage protein gp47/JayE
MPFQKSFDEILSEILVDFQNIFPDVDVAVGSLAYMKAAGYASGLWGLYKYQEWISAQVFCDTADPEHLEHHAWIRGLTRRAGETDAELLARLLEWIRRPPAGGNKYDYQKWALEVDDVAAAYAVPLGQGLGTVDLVLVANEATTGSEVPTQGLLDAVRAYIVDICPTSVKYLRVLAPSIITQAVTMTVSGAGANTAQTAADITAYLESFIPGQDLYRSQLSTIAVNDGADDATITTPAANVTATSYQMIRPGVISVS